MHASWPTARIPLSLSLSLSICPYLTSHLTSSNQCPYRADKAFASRSTWLRSWVKVRRRTLLFMSSCFSNWTRYVLLVFLIWLVGWEVSGHTAAILLIFVFQYAASLCSSHLAFFSRCFVKVFVVQPYSSTEMTTAFLFYFMKDIRLPYRQEPVGKAHMSSGLTCRTVILL